ncbi:MAG: DUF1573 domain-containing protein [Arcicella sp.]|jgi:hypothetical protein|nr:DUF1573 domain-containing protein [Arcicella sp.]
MKKIVILALTFGIFVACENKQRTDAQTLEEKQKALQPTADKFPVMQIDTPVVDLGKIMEGDTIMHVYNFKNTGNMPLVLSNVSASCGCTTPSYSTEPVAPGDKGFITVKFNSKGKEGKLNKTVTAFANTKPAENMVSFKIEVLPKTIK